MFYRDFFVVNDFNVERLGDEYFDALVSKGFKMPPNMNTPRTNFTRKKTFDKIAWAPRKSFSFAGNCNVVPFGHAVFQEGKKKKLAKKQVSDHLSLGAEFRVNKLTQELDRVLRR